MPAGHGKSRIIPAIARMIASTAVLPDVPKVIVVYNDSKLLENDKPFIEMAIAGAYVDIQFRNTDKDNAIVIHDKNTVVIIDEVDDVLVDKSFKLNLDWKKSSIA